MTEWYTKKNKICHTENPEGEKIQCQKTITDFLSIICACKPAVKQQYLNKNLFRRLNDKSKKEKCYDTEDRKKR